MKDEIPVVLASASPRRKALLAQIGVTARVQPAAVDETPQPGEAPARYVTRLARAKAEAVAARHPQAIVLGADTAVVLDGDILGKPRDERDAFALLARLMGREHEVLTAVCALRGGERHERLAATRVRLRRIEPAEMAAYWASGEPADKAGGYAIQGLGAVFVEHIAGSHSAVTGLPLFETADLLGRLGRPVLAPRPGERD